MSGLQLVIIAVVVLFWTHERYHAFDRTGSRFDQIGGLIGAVVGFLLLIAAGVRG